MSCLDEEASRWLSAAAGMDDGAMALGAPNRRLLRHVENVLLHARREHPAMDDLTVTCALRALARLEEAADLETTELIQRMIELEVLHEGVSEREWVMLYHHIIDAIGRRSSMRPGAREYLDSIVLSIE